MDIIITRDKLFNSSEQPQHKIEYVQIENSSLKYYSESDLGKLNIDKKNCFEIKEILSDFNKMTVNQQIQLKRSQEGIQHFSKLRESVQNIRQKLDIFEEKLNKQEQMYEQFNSENKVEDSQSGQLTDFLLQMTSKQEKTEQLYKDFEEQMKKIVKNIEIYKDQEGLQQYKISESILKREQICRQQVMEERQIDTIESILDYQCEQLESAQYCENQERIQQSYNSNEDYVFNPFVTFESMRKVIQGFATERNWDQYHSPRNLLLALQGELGELCEIFQWKGEVECGLKGFSYEEKVRVGEEMSDCLAYLVRFADRCRIDFCRAIERKFIFNGIKYPPKLCKGSDKKYTSYSHITNH